MFREVIFAFMILQWTPCDCKVPDFYTQTALFRQHGQDKGSQKKDFSTWLKEHYDEVFSGSGEIGDDLETEESSGGSDDVCKKMLDVTFILDGSESIGPVGFRSIVAYTKQILHRLDLTNCDNVGIVKFTDFANSETYLGSRDSKQDIFTRLDALEEPAQFISTEMNHSRVALALLVADEIVFSSRLGSRANSEKFIVLMTDGLQPKRDSLNQSLTVQKMVQRLDKKGVRILVLSVGKNLSMENLLKFTTKKDNVFPERRLSDVMDLLRSPEREPNSQNRIGMKAGKAGKVENDTNAFNFVS